jgi:diguanylate cyclase (GGDEF)-like protein
MVDVDNFKQVNDLYGHMVGDLALQAVARQCRASTRAEDIVGRYGGEEMVILMPDTSQEESRQAAQRLSESLASQPIVTDTATLFLTVSMGLAERDGTPTITLDQLIDRADQALLAAKVSGKNRVVLWDDLALEATDLQPSSAAMMPQHAERVLRLTTRWHAWHAWHELDALLQLICDDTAQALHVPIAAILLYEAEHDTLRTAALAGLPASYMGMSQPVSREEYQRLTNGARPLVIVSDLQQMEGLPNADLHRELDARTFISAPLQCHDQLVGVLNVATVGIVRVFRPDELALLQLLAEQVALVIENARQISALRRAYEALLINQAPHATREP